MAILNLENGWAVERGFQAILSSMASPLQAVVRAGRIEFEEPLKLPDGTQVLVTLQPKSPPDLRDTSAARSELYRLLDEAEEDVRNGDQGISVEAMRERLRA